MAVKQIILGGVLSAPEIALGCMRITGLDAKGTDLLVHTAMDNGINFFDHADIYAGGQAESHFAESIGMNPSLREKMILQTKCAIRPGVAFDFSKEHILKSADGSLARLKTDYIDIYILHRPDILMEPEEVAEAFSILKQSGKVRHFGVSNQNPGQIELLERCLGEKLIVNQVQLSIAHCPMFDAQLNVNMMTDEAIVRESGLIDYCRLKGITLQAWSPFQFGFFGGVFLDNPDFPELNAKIDEIAGKYGVTNSAVAVAWILRHPAKIQVIAGTTNKQRLTDICAAGTFELTRDEWYAIYMASGKKLP